jgi:hypothetical protein
LNLSKVINISKTYCILLPLIQTISQKANQQRHHHINVPVAPHVIISHVDISVFNFVKAVTANGNKITNTIVKSSKPFLTVVLTDAVGYLNSIRSLPLSLGLTQFN